MDFRLSARVAALPRNVLLELVEAMSANELSHAGRVAADAVLAKHTQTPAWALDSVLLSPDLLPSLFGSLEFTDCATAQVCRAWRNACVHGVELSDGTSARWIDRPQGPPIFPEREDVKTLFAAIHEGDGGLGVRLAALG